MISEAEFLKIDALKKRAYALFWRANRELDRRRQPDILNLLTKDSLKVHRMMDEVMVVAHELSKVLPPGLVRNNHEIPADVMASFEKQVDAAERQLNKMNVPSE